VRIVAAGARDTVAAEMTDALTIELYLASLPAERATALRAVRDVVNAKLPAGYEEGVRYKMIGWYVPHSVYPAGYHCDPKQPLPFASLASQKGHMALHLMALYANPELTAWFTAEYAKRGKRLDMGAACVRFKKLDDLPLDLVGELVARVPVDAYVARYEAQKPAKKKR
jgi:hypothetical protein